VQVRSADVRAPALLTSQLVITGQCHKEAGGGPRVTGGTKEETCHLCQEGTLSCGRPTRPGARGGEPHTRGGRAGWTGGAVRGVQGQVTPAWQERSLTHSR
jgi:hypothetical protein